MPRYLPVAATVRQIGDGRRSLFRELQACATAMAELPAHLLRLFEQEC